MKTTDQLYEELRAVIDNGSESMTHEDALEHVRALQAATEVVHGRYTVLVLRPDWIADPYGQDTYMAHVMAGSVETAQIAAQREAYQCDASPDDEGYGDPDFWSDYFVLAVFEGHLSDKRVTE
ncbi:MULTISPECIES: hypothetical protein [unclassified Acidovorax]|uniref:hypothetical protein n=1 Tax=unclassified Acidovorax TaxID=2684926 RepID=UPI000B3FA02B|nr:MULTISPECIES: hypothetical protein [unclassified Acidovorax]